MKYAIEMSSVAMIPVSDFINIGSGIQKLIGWIHRQHSDCVSLLSCFQIKESGLSMKVAQ
jgi:hypothetical protein